MNIVYAYPGISLQKFTPLSIIFSYKVEDFYTLLLILAYGA